MRSHSSPPPKASAHATPSLHPSVTRHRPTYTGREVAEMFSVCQRTLRRRIQDGTFPKPLAGLGRLVRFDADAVDRFRAQCSPR
jgi:excisionase family DNA binding protein